MASAGAYTPPPITHRAGAAPTGADRTRTVPPDYLSEKAAKAIKKLHRLAGERLGSDHDLPALPDDFTAIAFEEAKCLVLDIFKALHAVAGWKCDRVVERLIRKGEIKRMSEVVKSMIQTVPTVLKVADGPGGGVNSTRADATMSQEIKIRDSVGVLVGDHGEINVLHVCTVQRPVVDVAELLEVAADGTQSWGTNAFEFDSSSGGAGFWCPVGDAACTMISGSSGVVTADHAKIGITARHRLSGCRLDIGYLLGDPVVAWLAARAVAESNPDDAEGLDAERAVAVQLLPAAIRDAVRRFEPSDVIQDHTAQLEMLPRPNIRHTGRVIRVTHGNGVAIGMGNEVESHTRIRTVGGPVVRL